MKNGTDAEMSCRNELQKPCSIWHREVMKEKWHRCRNQRRVQVTGYRGQGGARGCQKSW